MTEETTNATTSEDATKDQTMKEQIFSGAFFAALTGISGRAKGQDSGSVVNEAYDMAERAVERVVSGKPVMTDAERINKVRQEAAKAAAMQPAILPSPGASVSMGGGRFQRPTG